MSETLLFVVVGIAIIVLVKSYVSLGPRSTVVVDATVLIAAMVFLVVLWLGVIFGATAHDDTDPPGGHSGLIIYTDQQTGQQYLGTARGGLTPRLPKPREP